MKPETGKLKREMTVEEGIHFIDLQRLIFARRGQAGSVPGFVSLVADRLRAVLLFGGIGGIIAGMFVLVMFKALGVF